MFRDLIVKLLLNNFAVPLADPLLQKITCMHFSSTISKTYPTKFIAFLCFYNPLLLLNGGAFRFASLSFYSSFEILRSFYDS